MKQLAVLIILIVGGLLAWLFASRLSADALGLAVGMIFGVLAGVPSALLVLATNRRDQARPGASYDDEDDDFARPARSPAPAWQPPVVVITRQPDPQQWPGQMVDSASYPVRPALPGPGQQAARHRQWRTVGEREEWLDEW